MSDEPVAMTRGQILVFGIYLIVLNLVLFYVLVKIWPGTVPLADEDRVVVLWRGGTEYEVLPEIRYLLIVAAAGALGSYIHLANSFVDYVGNRRLFRSWGWWYVLRPFIGMALAVIVYFVIRGGLIAGNSGVASLSPYGVAAISGLVGMFSRQATDKLREVFENLFKSQPPDRADKLRG